MVMWKTDKKEFSQKVYALWTNDKSLRKESTSGGAFTALARIVLAKGGSVYGAAFDESLVVKHVCIKNEYELYRLRGSKYVQSDLGDTYKQIKQQLLNKEVVLFSGTPCQVSGLYSFLGQSYEGYLFTVDVICHGTPSPKIFEHYKKWIGERYQSSIKEIHFRSKKYSWWTFGMQIVFEDGQVYYERSTHDPYLRAFLREYDIRPSCHSCQYNHFDRPSDITLSDFWWYRPSANNDYDTDEGISMAMINSENGATLFGMVTGCTIIEKTIDDARRTNRALRECYPPNINREKFWNDVRNESFPTVIKRYLYPEKARGKYSLYVDSHYHNQPNIIKQILRIYYWLFDSKFCRDK